MVQFIVGNFNRDNRGSGGRSFGRKDFGGSRSFDRPTIMHKTTCSDCGKECEVPFRPTGERPVYCRDCFAKNGGDQPRRSFGGDNSDARPPFRKFEDNRSQAPNNVQLDAINSKLDQLLRLLTPKEETHSASSGQAKTAVQVPTKKKKVSKKVSETPTETPEE